MQTSTSSNITLADGVGHTFFARDPVPGEEAMNRADPDRGATLDQPRLDLDQGHVALLGYQFTDEAGMRLDLARMPVAPARLRNSPTMLKSTLSPADRA